MTWNDSLTKTTPQEACGAYIKNAPRGFLPQGAWLYMDLSAVFSLAAVNGCAGQGRGICRYSRCGFLFHEQPH